MPLYEYKCKSCGSLIEFRTSMDKKEEMAESLRCDACGSAEFAQVLGGFAFTQSSSGSTQAAPSAPAGGCCPGGVCGL